MSDNTESTISEIESGKIKPNARYEEDVEMSAFGLASLKAEGFAVHPDEIEGDLSDKQYYKQLKAYYSDTGDSVFKIFCVRDGLLQKLKEEFEE